MEEVCSVEGLKLYYGVKETEPGEMERKKIERLMENINGELIGNLKKTSYIFELREEEKVLARLIVTEYRGKYKIKTLNMENALLEAFLEDVNGEELEEILREYERETGEKLSVEEFFDEIKKVKNEVYETVEKEGNVLYHLTIETIHYGDRGVIVYRQEGEGAYEGVLKKIGNYFLHNHENVHFQNLIYLISKCSRNFPDIIENLKINSKMWLEENINRIGNA